MLTELHNNPKLLIMLIINAHLKRLHCVDGLLALFNLFFFFLSWLSCFKQYANSLIYSPPSHLANINMHMESKYKNLDLKSFERPKFI